MSDTSALPDATPFAKAKWWHKLARSVAVQFIVRVAQVITLLAVGWIASQINAYASGLDELRDEMTVVKAEISELTDIVAAVPKIADALALVSNRMTAMETRGDAARTDRAKQSDQLQKIIDQQSQTLQILAAQGAQINGIDQRIVRMENRGN